MYAAVDIYLKGKDHNMNIVSMLFIIFYNKITIGHLFMESYTYSVCVSDNYPKYNENKILNLLQSVEQTR